MCKKDNHKLPDTNEHLDDKQQKRHQVIRHLKTHVQKEVKKKTLQDKSLETGSVY